MLVGRKTDLLQRAWKSVDLYGVGYPTPQQIPSPQEYELTRRIKAAN